MANNRLTWQNVAAPDFSDSIQASAMASRLMSEGLGSFATVAGDRGDRMIDVNSAEALMAAQQYSDPAAWQKAMAEGGIKGATGFDASRLNAAAITDIGNRATQLFANADTAAGTAQTIGATANAFDANSRANIAAPIDNASTIAGTNQTVQNTEQDAKKFNFDFEDGVFVQGRTRKGLAEDDAAIQRGKDAEAWANSKVRDDLDLEASLNQNAQDKTITPEVRDARAAVIKKRATEFFTPTMAATAAAAELPDAAQIDLSLGTYQSQQAMENSTNGPLNAWTKAKAANFDNSSDPLLSLLTGLNGYNGKIESEGGTTPTTFTTSAGKVDRIFKAAKLEFPNVSDAVIAGVMQDSVTSGWLLLGDGQELKVDENAIWDTLTTFNDPVLSKELEDQRLAIAAQSQEISKIQADKQAVLGKISLAMTKGQSTTKLEAELRAIAERTATRTGASTLSDGAKPKHVKAAEKTQQDAQAAADKKLGQEFLQSMALGTRTLPPLTGAALPFDPTASIDRALADSRTVETQANTEQVLGDQAFMEMWRGQQ